MYHFFREKKTEDKTSLKNHTLSSLNVWGHLFSDVKIYNVPEVSTFIFDLLPIEGPFYSCVINADF